MLKLLIEDGDGKSKLAPINPDNAEGITIGRKEGNTIRLKERNVSRNHARIFSTPEGVFIEPVAARYGLKVNSEKIEGKTKIGFGDEIRIGDYHLYLQDENNQPVAKQEEQGVYDLPIGQQPKFVVITSNFAGKELVITKSEVTIGRAPTNLLHLDHISVSGTHAKVTRNHRGEFILEDLNSSNGTVVNGNPLTGKHLLQSGDTIMLGHVGMRYCSPGELWYLHLSDDDVNRRQGMSTGTVILIVALCVLVTALLMVVLLNGKDKEPQTPVAQQPTSGISNDDVVMMDVKNSLLLCKQYIMNGDFEKARVECDKAESLAPNDPNVSAQLDELRKEETSNREYEHILRLLDEKACQDALTEIEMLDSRSYAGRQARMDNLEQKAIDCRDKALVKQFNEGIEREDYVEAKNALDTLTRAGTLDDSKLDRMRNELDRKMNPGRPRTGGGGSGRGNAGSGGADSAAAAAPAAAPAPAPEPGGTSFASIDEAKKAIMKCKQDKKACDAAYKQFKNDPDITCKYGTTLKSMGKTCDAYKILKKVESSCQGAADFIAKHEECK